MGKTKTEDAIDFEGERIRYRWIRDSLLPGAGCHYQYCLEADYDEPISIMDHGYGLDYALGLLRNELSIQKNNRPKKRDSA